MSRTRSLLLLILASALSGFGSRTSSAIDPAARQELDDLYEIFKDEMSDRAGANLYQAMGNRLQLDGLAYNYVFRALNALDRLRATEKAPDFAGKDQSLARQLSTAQQEFAALRKNLAWPRVQFELHDDRIELSGGSSLALDAGIAQSLILAVSNRTTHTMALDLAFDGSAAIKALTVTAGATRHVRATVERDRPGPGRLEITASAGSARLARTLPVDVAPTGILEGLLVYRGGGAATARVRVTTGGGRYLPPEAHTYGLILKMFGPEHDQVANRWFYGDGRFRIRAPAGPVRIAIRKGLEYRSLNLDVDIPAGTTVRKTITIERWIDMSARGWQSADVHLHYFDPPTVRWEMEAEDLAVTNVLVMNQRGAITAREYFTGALDPISDKRHLVYYNEEFRNGMLGHLILLNLKRVVEPISTGRLGTAFPQLFRGAHFDLLEDPSGRQGSVASRTGCWSRRCATRTGRGGWSAGRTCAMSSSSRSTLRWASSTRWTF